MKTSDAKKYLHQSLAGRYSIDRLVGEGSFAWVYHAVSRQKGWEVAIKVLHSAEPTAAMRFAREIEVLKALPKNSNVVSLIDHGTTEDGRPFQVIEFVDGITLKDGIRLCKSLIPRQAVSFMIELCQAFVELHQLGVAHRDVKPENILLARQGGIKLIDFGLIRDAQGILQLLEREDPLDDRRLFSQELDRWTVAGTPEYMAPEQFSDAKMDDLAKARTDTWSDVFSLGVIFFQLLSGNKPFPMRLVTNKGYHREILRYMRWRMSLTDEDYPGCPNIDSALDSIMRKSLRQDPRQRQPDARALMADLASYRKTGAGVPEADEERTQMLNIEQRKSLAMLREGTLDIGGPTSQRKAPPQVDENRGNVTSKSSISELSTQETIADAGDAYYDVSDFDDDDDATHLDANPEIDAIVAGIRGPTASAEIFFPFHAEEPTSHKPQPQLPSLRETERPPNSEQSQQVIAHPQPSPRPQPVDQSPPQTGQQQVIAHKPPTPPPQPVIAHKPPTSPSLAVAPEPPKEESQQVRSHEPPPMTAYRPPPPEHPQAHPYNQDAYESTVRNVPEGSSFNIRIEASDSVIITEDFQLEPDEEPLETSEPIREEPQVEEQPSAYVPAPPKAPLRPPLPPWLEEPDWDEHAPTHVQNPSDVDDVLRAIRKKKD